MFIYFTIFVIAFAGKQSDVKCLSAYCSACEGEVCTNCIPNFILDNGKCVYCRDAVAHCHLARDGKCIDCFHGYYLHENQCIKADPHCEDYFNGTCKECRDGYLLVEQECKKCQITGCEECPEGLDTCKECGHGYVLENGTCVKPVDFCEKYVHHNHHHRHHDKCLECMDGYRLVNGKCVTIEEANCRRWENDTCVQCWGPYRPVDGKCTENKAIVIDHCVEYDDEEFECDECEAGWVAMHDYNDGDFDDKDDDKDDKDDKDDDDKKPHQPEHDDKSEQEKPDFPFFPDGSKDDRWPPFKPNHDDKSESDNRWPPFLKRHDKDPHHHVSGCVKCSAKCETCEDTPSNCVTCAKGYYMNDRHKCEMCSLLSTTCSDYKTEVECNQCNIGCGWGGEQCGYTHCVAYRTYDLGFWNTTVCDKCEEGYVLDKLRKQCVQVDGGCETTVNGKCVECAPGYFMTKEFTCEKCSDKCKTCVFNATTCLSCYDSNETLSITTCNACADPLCEVCDENTLMCKKCTGNYTVGDLGDCVMGCFTEDCDGKCTMCSDKENEMDIYYPPTVEGVCLKYSQMPTNPENGNIIDGAYPVMIFLLAFLFFLL